VSGTAEIIESRVREVTPEGVFLYPDLLQAACDMYCDGAAIRSGVRKKGDSLIKATAVY